MALAVGTVALVAFHLWASSRIGGPSVVFDESGYLGNARWMAGGSTWEMPRSPTYAVGYPVLLAPVMALADDADTQWRAVLAVNAVLLASVFPLVAKALADVFGVPWRRAAVVAVVGAAAPAVVAAGVSAIAENLVLPLVPALVLGAFAMADRSPTRCRWSRHTFGLVVAALVTTHPRFTLGMAVAAVALGAAGWTKLVARRVAAANALLLVLGVAAGSVVSRAVFSARWTERERLEGGPSDWLDLVRSWRGLRELALAAIGQGWYLAAGSVGLVVVGAVVAVRTVRSGTVDAPRRFAVGITLTVAASVFATSVLFFAQNQFRADHWVYGRHNDSFTPLLVSVGLASLLATRPWRAKLRDLAVALVAIVGLGTIVAVARDPLVFDGQFSPFAVPAIARWTVASPGSAFELATAVAAAGLLVVAIAVLVALSGRAPTQARPRLRQPVMAVTAGALVVWSAYVGYAAVDITDDFESANSAGWDVPAQVRRLGISTLAIEERAAKSLPTLTYPFHLPDVDVTTYSAQRGDEPKGPYVVARLDDPARASAGDRIVLLDEGGYYPFFGAPNGLAVWVRPGPEQDRLAADGLLLPPGFPVALAPSARSIELAVVGGAASVREVPSGGSIDVEVTGRHAGSGAPWPDRDSFGLDGRVQVQAQVSAIAETADDQAPAPGSGELAAWTRPGDPLTSTVRIYAVDQRFEPLAPGRYRVVLGVGQAGGDSFSPAVGGDWFSPAVGGDGSEVAFEVRVVG